MTANYSMIFVKIFTQFTNLRCLKFNPSSSFRGALVFDMLSESNISSTLLELHVTVSDTEDCLIILHECFDQLRILYVNVYGISTGLFDLKPKVGYLY